MAGGGAAARRRGGRAVAGSVGDLVNLLCVGSRFRARHRRHLTTDHPPFCAVSGDLTPDRNVRGLAALDQSFFQGAAERHQRAAFRPGVRDRITYIES